MKLIIDIPEQMYLNAKADTLCGARILVSAIKNGIPLEDIKAEIKNCKNKFFKNEDSTLSPYMNGTIDRMLEIIDKHISGKENI